MLYCSNCGTASEESANFCLNCGTAIQKKKENGVKLYKEPTNVSNNPTKSNHQPITGGIKALLYISTIFITLVGIIAGIIYMNDPIEENRSFGKGLLIFSIIWTIVAFILPIIIFTIFFVPFGMDLMYY